RAAPGTPKGLGEGTHVRRQLVLWHRVGRPGVDVLDNDPVGKRHPVWQVRAVAPGVDGDLDTAPGKRGGQLGDVDVLPAGVDAAEKAGQGVGRRARRAAA